ncbi:MAG: choice-of-anchor J domain-containing protein [Prevotella sp.]|nr:choice-of-anchor J domain-containing protein [Prevotella sp.]
MKQMKYILMAIVGTLFVACMGEDYAEPALEQSPYGNNALTESNLLTIQQLKAKYANIIANSAMVEVEEETQIKGVITGNDIGGNIYNEVSIQDETGALLVCIAQGGLYGPLAVGQEVLIELKGLMFGGYGQQPEIGGVYTNQNTGAQSIGRMSRYLWNTHYKLIGTPNPSKVEEMIEVFDQSQIANESYLAANCGKIMKIKGVTLKDANGKKVYAPDDGSVALTANCANRAFAGIDQNSLVLRTSTFADFANTIMPEGEHDIVGIFTRYRNTWQVLLRTLDDVREAEPEPTALFEESFLDPERKQGDFTIVDVLKSDDLNYVWNWDSRYGMKASAYVNSTYYPTDSWLISPAIDLSGKDDATLSFAQAWRYGNGVDDFHIYASAEAFDGTIDASKWTELNIDQWPDGTNWNFLTSKASLKAFAGKSGVRIAFRYTSTDKAAATWEIQNVSID